MKIGILGAGITGLSIARLLKENFDVEILERAPDYGGIAKTREIQGIAYHQVGGHCFNSKHQDVLDFVFNEVLKQEEWHLTHRDATIKLGKNEVSYPIEFSIKEIHQFDPTLALTITKDFLNADDSGNYQDLEDWFRQKFGDALTDNYFLPYNEKIWNRPLNQMSPKWVEGKLPIPNKQGFFRGLIERETDKMPHSSFYYPNTNNQKTFIDELAKGTSFLLNYNVEKIKWEQGQWLINDEKSYDILISTIPLNILPGLISGCPQEVIDASHKLKYNSITTMLWATKETDHTWTYIPDKSNIFHRYIHIGNFFSPVKNYTITEAIGERTYEEMVNQGLKDTFLIEPIEYYVSDHAYVVFDDDHGPATAKIKHYLNEINLYSLGRFGDWEYHNMDICIKRSLDTANTILKKYGLR